MSGAEYRTAISRVGELLLSTSVPLYLHHGGREEPLATGFIVQDGEVNYLVTAAHVLDDVAIDQLCFYESTNRLFMAYGQVRRSSIRGTAGSDSIDVSVVRLAEGRKPDLSEVGKKVVPVSWLHSGAPSTGMRHLMVPGYPATRSKVRHHVREIHVESYIYRSDEVEDCRYDELGYSREDHVLLPLDLKKGYDHNGKHRNFPKPRGMSGSPIFEVYTEAEGAVLDHFPLVGMLIEYRKTQKIIVGVSSRYVLDAIADFSR